MTANAANYYDLLRVSRRAQADGVRRAYRRLAQRYHPDKLPGNADAERVMAALNEAYAVLSDPQRRALYDRAIAQARERAQLERQRRLAVIDDPGAAWPWYLLFATIAFATLAVGVSIYKGYFRGAAVASPASAITSQAGGTGKLARR